VNTATAINFKELVTDSRLVVQPPLKNPLLSSTPIAVTHTGEGVDVEVDLCPYEQVSTDNVLERFIERAQRDVERHPDSARAHTNLGLALLNAGNTSNAIKEFEVALQRESGDYVAAMNLARVKLALGDLEAAEERFQGILRHFPQDASSLMNLAFICMRRDDFQRARQLLYDVVVNDEKASVPRYHLAMVLLKLGKPNDAIGQLKEAARNDVRSPELHHALGVAYSVTRQLNHAAKAFKAALTLAPNMVDATHGLALILLQQNKPQDAIFLLHHQVNKNPDDFNSREILARAYVNAREYARARSQLNFLFQNLGPEAERDGDRARVANNIGTCFAWEGNRAEAKKWLKNATELNPATPIPFVNLARTLVNENSLDNAASLLESCKQRFNKDEETRVMLAICYERMGNFNNAIEQVRPVIESGTPLPTTYAYVGALLAERLNDFAGGISVFEQGLKKNPLNSAIINNFAYANLMNGRVEDARRLLESLPRGTELYPELLATIGLLHLWDNDFGKGQSFYQRAAEMAASNGNPDLSRMVRQKMHLELARAYFRRKDLRSALSHIRSGLAMKHGRRDYQQDLESVLASLNDEQPGLFPEESGIQGG
jgi:Tfp pilus assembly protein PilF